jgi:hypothetical protein
LAAAVWLKFWEFTKWGEGFAVDVWWAKQRKDQGTQPVKTPAHPAYRDEVYFGYLGKRSSRSDTGRHLRI